MKGRFRCKVKNKVKIPPGPDDKKFRFHPSIPNIQIFHISFQYFTDDYPSSEIMKVKSDEVSKGI